MNRKTRAMMAASAAAVVVTLTGWPTVARAADVTWDGGGTNDFTDTAANWASDLAPAAMDALIFDGAVRTTPDNNIAAGTIFRGVTFAAGASPFTLNGNAVTLFANANVVNNSANLQTVNLPITLAKGVHTINGGTGGLTLNGAVTRNNAAAVAFSGAVTAPTLSNDATGIIGSWATIGADYAMLNPSNQVVVYNNYLDIGHNPTIASTPGRNVRWIQTAANPNVPLPSGVVEMNTLNYSIGGNPSGDATVSFQADTTLRFGASGGVFRSNPAFSGRLNFGPFATDGVGAITAGGADNTPGELVFVVPNNGITIRPKVVDNGPLGVVRVVNVGGPGRGIELNAAGTYSGGTYIVSGQVRSNHPQGLGTGAVHVEEAGHMYLDEFATANTVERLYANDFHIAGDGTLASGALSQGALRVGRTNVGIAASATVHLVGDARIQFRGSTGVGGQVYGKITGGYNLKLGGGGLATSVGVLHNTANDWTGNTSFDQGIIRLGNSEVIPHGPGKGNVNFSFTTGDLDLNGKTETINGLTGGTNPLDIHRIINSSATAAHLIVGDNDANGTFGSLEEGIGSAVISGTTAVTKIGAGTQVFGGNNTYTGNTTMAGGVLSVAVTESVGAASNTLVFNGGTLHTSAPIAFARNATVNAGGGTFDSGGFDSSVGNVTGAGSFTKNSAGKLTVNQVKVGGAVAVAAGTLEIPTNGGASGMLESTALTVADGALLAMNDNDFIVNYGPSDPSPEFALRDKVKAIYQGGTSGISYTPGAGDVAIAVSERTEWGFSEFNGVALDSTAVVGKYTYFGDANLDGKVTSDDYVAVDVGLGTGDSWVQGDFNFSGTVTSDDYVAIDVNLGKGSPTPLAFAELKAEMVALHTAMFGDEYVQKLAEVEAEGFAALVPEPGSLSLVGLAAGMLGRRRRSHRVTS